MGAPRLPHSRAFARTCRSFLHHFQPVVDGLLCHYYRLPSAYQAPAACPTPLSKRSPSHCRGASPSLCPIPSPCRHLSYRRVH
eukprot:scaffold128437_cov27-Tisochrysis_lutea.AAC.2